MSLNYAPLYDGSQKWYALAKDLTLAEIVAETNRLYDQVQAILDECTDADIAFVPHDPHAHDPYAPEDQQNIGWTIGHLVAHITATNEETAVFSSLLARGIPQSGRIRVEAAWEEIDTVAKANQRLAESRRIVLAYLSAWPDTPNLETLRTFDSERAAEYFGAINAPASAFMGLSHHNEHIAQFEEVLRQAKAVRA